MKVTGLRTDKPETLADKHQEGGVFEVVAVMAPCGYSYFLRGGRDRVSTGGGPYLKEYRIVREIKEIEIK